MKRERGGPFSPPRPACLESRAGDAALSRGLRTGGFGTIRQNTALAVAPLQGRGG